MATATQRGEWDVYVAHSVEDLEIAREVQAVLAEAGFTAFVATDNIRAEKGSETWTTAVNQALQACRWLVVIVTPHSVLSEWVRFEVDYAFDAVRDGRKPPGSPIPLWISGPEPRDWPPTFQAQQAIDIRGAEERSFGLNELVDRLRGSTEGEIPVLRARIQRLESQLKLALAKKEPRPRPWWQQPLWVLPLPIIFLIASLGYFFLEEQRRSSEAQMRLEQSSKMIDLSERLSSPDQAERRRAAIHLAAFGNEAVPLLVSDLVTTELPEATILALEQIQASARDFDLGTVPRQLLDSAHRQFGREISESEFPPKAILNHIEALQVLGVNWPSSTLSEATALLEKFRYSIKEDRRLVGTDREYLLKRLDGAYRELQRR
jgi:hypothetical protein